MKRDLATILIGLVFLAAGFIIGGVFLGFFELDINLAGWWTIFIIAPALFSIAQSGLNVGNLIVLAVGAILLLNAQQIYPIEVSWRLIFPVVLIAIGIQILMGGKQTKGEKKPDCDNRQGSSAFFSGQDINYGNEVFTGASYNATFGAVTANLRKVTLNRDAVITVSALFGGIDIILPDNVKLITHVVPILGGLECKYTASEDPAAHTIIIRGSATFGGITVK